MNVHDYLSLKHVPFQEIRHTPQFQAILAARTLGTPARQFGKTVVLDVDGAPVVAVIPASCTVDLKKVKRLYKAKHCHLASEELCHRLFPESERGAWPPFGSMRHIPTLLDEKLLQNRQITLESDCVSEAIRMNVEDYETAEKPQIASITRIKSEWRHENDFPMW
jgi:prolyl-tRNA editing enzyme YbaK/EbsC (Cys-tRNA(Pro) deacylase)